MTDSVYWIWLQLMFGIGTRRAELFYSYFADPQKLYREIEGKDRAYGMLTEAEQSAWQPAMEQAKNQQARTLKKGCNIVTPDHPQYPRLLNQIYAKPAVLYVKGDLSCLEGVSIAIVGTRHHTDYGERAAKQLAGDLALQGIAIVSGLAKGIDTICHKAAIENGGRTVGVLGCGIDVDYPMGSGPLKTAMVEEGAVISEFPLGTPPRPSNFPIRNRVIAGMCTGTLVVEADKSSGSLITANHALEQGRDVFAVPGSIFSMREQGTHALIKDGAKLVECAADILEEYDIVPEKITGRDMHNIPQERPTIKVRALTQEVPEDDLPPESQQTLSIPTDLPLTEEAKAVLPLLDGGRLGVDELCARSGMDMAALHTALTELEIYGLVQAHPGRVYARI